MLGELDISTLVGGIVLLLSSIGSSVLAVRSALGTAGGRRLLATLVTDVERMPDGTVSPKPETNVGLVADAVATRVLDRLDPRLDRIEGRLGIVEGEVAKVREEQGAALEREAAASDANRAMQLQLSQRIARVEGVTRVGAPLDEADVTPVHGIPLQARRRTR